MIGLDDFEILSELECRDLLATANIGRVALSMAALPVILPVNYIVEGGDVLFLSGTGGKLHAALTGQVLAFEVDSMDEPSRSGWSALAIGMAAASRPGDDTPAPQRWISRTRDQDLVRLRPSLISGRRLHAALP
jgi:hypothetical protein